MKYRLFTYDVWGNVRDGFVVNDIFSTDTVIEISEETSNVMINRKLGGRGIQWNHEENGTIYGEDKRNGKPVGELRPHD